MKSHKQILKNTQGQMTIFVALMFQVLFVLFAMSINVGLVVYDKVNLQNSVDLAAYYGAQKQAEMLNAIAHQNYQIRQAWKLLSWRYRVLGQFGLGRNMGAVPYKHPGYSNASNFINEDIFQSGITGTEEQREYPVICVGYPGTWLPNFRNQNNCKERDFSIPSIIAAAEKSQLGIITSPLASITYGSVRSSANTIITSCGQNVAYNYLYSAGISIGFRLEQKARKELIYSLFYNMQGLGGEFTDLDGQSVEAGVKKMVEKNLTFGNSEPNLKPPQIQYFNSLKNAEASDFLNEIKVEPIILYADADNTVRCKMNAQSTGNLPTNTVGKNYILQKDNEVDGWITNMSGRTEESSIYQYSVGFEKNPWSWVYSGVKATVQTRPLFFPFGEPLTMTAVAFAKPFGGRIGPWYKSSWGSGSRASNSGPLVDPLLPKTPSEVNIPSSNTVSDISHNFFPNYSRFPGDPLGLRSKLAMAAMTNLKNLTNATAFSPTGPLTAATSWSDTNDSLVWDDSNNNSSYLPRRMEIAALAPDLFDATYYSIEPAFSKYYLKKLKTNKDKILKPGPKVGSVSQVAVLGDLGSRAGSNEVEINATDQIEINNIEKAQEAYHFIKEPEHLLTSWLHPEKYLNFSTEEYEKKFAKCETWQESLQTNSVTPGVCRAQGGRVGYSVKLISSKLLKSNNLELGGADTSSGPLNNPPPENFF